MSQTTILQVGDIHFPSSKSEQYDLDDKDPGFPIGLKDIISRKKLKTVFQSIHLTLEEENVDASVFMGDLTDRGELDGYHACLAYITGSLQLGKGNLREDLFAGLLPGNHDIDRKQAKIGSIQDKFRPLETAIRASGFEHFPTTSVVASKIKNDDHGAKLILLNSCWGCGEPEFIPEPFRDAIFETVNQLIESGEDKYLKTYYDHQLDTPAISAKHIADAVREAISCGPSVLPIVCAHHNLLPQHTTRLAPYTELVNSGSLRASLVDLNRTVIFLHGHIHEDPIEIISGVSGGSIVSISAPHVIDGYNVLKVRHDRNGMPFLCYVDQYRFDNGGVIRLKDTEKISLLNGKFRSANGRLNALYQMLLRHRTMYWSELVSEIELSGTLKIETEELLEMIELLSSDDSVVIINRQDSFDRWMLRASV